MEISMCVQTLAAALGFVTVLLMDFSKCPFRGKAKLMEFQRN